MTKLIELRRKPIGSIDRGVVSTPEIDVLLAADAPVALGVSGGKDSCALVFATVAHLDAIGHRGPRMLVHSDLGRVEWRDSLPTCERLARAVDLPLVVVKREAGDMMDRWLVRWRNNVARYAQLEAVKIILPWSTPSMRFCTSELKTAVICRELVRRFPGQRIVSCSGIRRAESAKRKQAAIAKEQKKLASTPRNRARWTTGIDWNPIIEWSHEDIYAHLAHRGFALHEAYTRYAMSRVSCAFCIMGSASDIVASTTCSDNHAIYREMVDLEIRSTFAFQGDSWLGDVAPHVLSAAQIAALASAKDRAHRRRGHEARIPEHLLYTEGWPTILPTPEEAELIAEVRRGVAHELDIEIGYTDADTVSARYVELYEEARACAARKAAKRNTTKHNDARGSD